MALAALTLWVAGCSNDPSSTAPSSSLGGSVAPPPTAAGPFGAAGSPGVVPITPAGPNGQMGAGPDVLPNMPTTPITGAAKLPCDVGTVFATKCASCHGASPIGGAPMPLVSPGDFSAPLKSIRTAPGETMEVAKLVKLRINDDAMPMPPGGLLPDAERTMINSWLDRGHPQAPATAPTCALPMQTVTKPGPVANPDGTTCYQFRNHGQPNPGDTTPYGVIPGEHYVSFFYSAPWTEPTELVSWRTIYDNQKVMHHWLLYSTLGVADGTFAPSIGTHIGDAAELVAGWAVGGNDVHMPPDVGLQLPAPGAGLLLEWHFYNTTGAEAEDSSAVEICTVPAGSQKHTAGMTWLGTENFNGPFGMPARMKSEYSGTCLPSREGMNATDPIRIFTFWPHMHNYGRHMKTVINRVDGKNEEIFDKPFDFNYQITYPATIDLNPGDTITSTCTFMNTSDLNVAFGPSTEQEMCYQFAFSYPVRALSNGVLSLVGATNTCW